MTTENPHAMPADQEPPISEEGFAELVEMVGPNMQEVLNDLLSTYLEESAGLVEAMQEALAKDVEAEMLRPSHSLKSSSASIGAMRLSRLCAQLEDYLRSGRESLDVPAQVGKIAGEYERVREALQVRMQTG